MKPYPKRGPTRRQRRPGLVLLGLVLSAWAIAATVFAWTSWSTVKTLRQEQEEARLENEAKVKALTRRLVGVASHQVLEQEGLGGRLADIISRQVELENRQANLTAVAERLGIPVMAPMNGAGPNAAVTTQPAVPVGIGTDPRAPQAGTAAPGSAPARPTPRNGTLGPRSSLEAPSTGGPDLRQQNTSGVSLRQQFAAIEGSISALEGSQRHFATSLGAGAERATATIRTTLEGLGLTPAAEQPEAPVRKRLSLAAASTSAAEFDFAYERLERSVRQLQRWRGAAEQVPLRRPIEGDASLTSNFGVRKDPFTASPRMHSGIDFRGAVGTPVRAAGAGRVVTAEASGGYGNLVEIEHPTGVVTRYAHLSTVNVGVGEPVTAATIVGLLGSTGRSTGPHLHYETRMAGTAVDPMRFLLAGAQLTGQPAAGAVQAEPDHADATSLD